ncbi:YheC/YheD family protein [Thermoactinomyces sp. DSM 45892]|uniref:YheC/YheD family endospore coat-associated protein n=1 Tax=Thermoactinomyces sp. DSM 45892 TaxID=1882753 RepID=UPI000894C9CA|nr:YheC/YheD family protein [Thermoactinomyces sp. DSM 45892]SDY79469.1 YheC/D like ATP-grasp [Thermoactinomyces sp. DSM 45892]
MRIQWIKKTNNILLPRNPFAQKSSLPDTMSLHFGSYTCELQVKISKKLPDRTLGIPAQPFPFPIPVLPYEVQIKEDEIHIGPVIGILLPSLKKYPYFACHVKKYPQLKGLIYVFTLRNVKTKTRTIQGSYFNPKARDEKEVWCSTRLPFPDAMYRRMFCKKIPTELANHVSGKVFNSRTFSKWILWKWLSQTLREHLPETKKLVDIQSFQGMIDKYGSVFLKPNISRRAVGLFLVKKKGEKYHFIDRDQQKTILTQEGIYQLLEKLQTMDYMIQQDVLPDRKDFSTDFRVIMQKGKRKQWTCVGILARIGEKGSITTNFREKGQLRKGAVALKKMFSASNQEIKVMEEEIKEVCKQACQVIDEHGLFGDVGLDIAVDSEKRIWLLEINKYHDLYMPLYIKNNRQMFDQVMTNPLEYAKSLAGFTIEKK